MSVSDDILNESIAYQVSMARFGAATAADVRALLDAAEKDLLAKLKARIDAGKEGTWTTKKLTAVLDDLRSVNTAAYGEAASVTREALSKTASDTVSSIVSVVKDASPDKEVASYFNLTRITGEQLAAMVKNDPISVGTDGKLLLEEVFSGLAAGKEKIIRQTVRMGMVEGEGIDSIVSRLRGSKAADFKDGLLEAPRRNVEALVRTAVNSTSNQAAQMLYEQNADILKGLQWHSTLDKRTSPICQVRDGKVFPVAEGPRPPAHINCRSFMIPVLKSWEELGIPAKDLKPATRASMDGQVPADLNYEGWLKKQPLARIEDILGKQKAAAFLAGESTLRSFLPEAERKADFEARTKEIPATKFEKAPAPAGPTPEELAKADIERRLYLYRSDLKRALIDDTRLPTRFAKLLEDLPADMRTKLEKEVEKAKAKLAGSPAAPPVELKFSDFKKIGEAKGSRPGGTFVNSATGEKWYMKFPGDTVATKNELLANRLYRMAGVEVPETTVVRLPDGNIGIASRWQDGLKQVGASELSVAKGVREGFAVDAWLANWDVVGAGYDNMLLNASGQAIRVDNGGSMLFRAKGALKGSKFGTEVSELRSFVSHINPTASRVFGNITETEIGASARKVLAITDQQIFDTLKVHGPFSTASENFDLALKLIERKNYIATAYPESVPGWVAPRRVLRSMASGDLEFKYSEPVIAGSPARSKLLLDRLSGADEMKGMYAAPPKIRGGVWTVDYFDGKTTQLVGRVTARLYQDESVIYKFAKVQDTSLPTLSQKLLDDWDKTHRGRHLTDAEVEKVRQVMQSAKPFMRVPSNGSTFQVILEGGFKNQIQLYEETGVRKGQGMVDPARRKTFEQAGFSVPKDAPLSTYPKYGYWSAEGTGAKGPSQYGDIRVLFKDEVRQRAKATIGDSLDWSVGRSTGYAQENLPFQPDAPHNRITAYSRNLSRVSSVDEMEVSYVEAQYYGELTIRDIDTVYVSRSANERLSAKVRKMLNDANISIVVDR